MLPYYLINDVLRRLKIPDLVTPSHNIASKLQDRQLRGPEGPRWTPHCCDTQRSLIFDLVDVGFHLLSHFHLHAAFAHMNLIVPAALPRPLWKAYCNVIGRQVKPVRWVELCQFGKPLSRRLKS